MTTFPFAIVGFDLDGTLLDTAGDLGVALNHALALIGRPAVSGEQTRDLIGGGAKRMLERALALTGGAEGIDVAALHRDLVAFYARNIAAHTCHFPGGLQMLDDLAARGVKLAIATNKLEELAVKLLDELGLTSRFYTIIGGDTLGPGRAKPKPDMLHEMVARAGLGPSARAAFIGDTTYDTHAARAAGLPCVAVSFGFNDLPPAELGADAVIDHYDQLVPVLETL
ncbi:MAG: HAD-IA family hydrolase [Sphingomonadales bacterium]|nr:HAD-IA family hydrolase [Sphingomonadales bacterium]